MSNDVIQQVNEREESVLLKIAKLMIDCRQKDLTGQIIIEINYSRGGQTQVYTQKKELF